MNLRYPGKVETINANTNRYQCAGKHNQLGSRYRNRFEYKTETYLTTLSNTHKGTIKNQNPMTINAGKMTKNVYGISPQIHNAQWGIYIG